MRDRFHILHLVTLIHVTAMLNAGGLVTRAVTPVSYVALGDSFAAGIGAGQFFPAAPGQKDPNRNNACARMTGSYPALMAAFIPQFFTRFDFLACSGDVLDNITAQIGFLGGDRYDAVSLSISGNDFLFGPVVAACVYPLRFKLITEANANVQCNAALQKSQDLINGAEILNKYVEKVGEIRDTVLNPNGHIYITGYAEFFSSDGKAGDDCDNSCFFHVSAVTRTFLCILDMKSTNRNVMNSLVDQVNKKIQFDLIKKFPDLQGRLHFIDINGLYDNHRFCEPRNGKDIWGKNESDVFFFEIASDVEETGAWDGPADFQDVDLYFPKIVDADLNGTDPNADGDFKGRGISDSFQQHLVFHPKQLAHQGSAVELGGMILRNQAKPDDISKDGEQFCMGFGPGGGESCFIVPNGCVVLKPIDNTTPTVFCSNGTEGQLQNAQAASSS